MTLNRSIASPTDALLEGAKPIGSVASRILDDWADRLVDKELAVMTTQEYNDPSDWISTNFYVDRPRNMQTAAMLKPGPIRLAEYQKRIVDEALSRDSDGKLNYTTILWSEPKKSGKTALAAAVGMYMAMTNKAGNIYCLANDGKQSQDRIFNAMSRCISLHNKLGGMFLGQKATYSPPLIKFPNGTRIEALPCDAAGEAGAEPLLTIWSEMWGYAQKHKERIWTEMTIPPTLYGYAMRWVESYAGYRDESNTLWTLYNQGVNNGTRHPKFPNLPVYYNKDTKQLSYWSEEPRMPWQEESYYRAERGLLTPNEFARIHRNQWVTSTSSLFDDILYWDRCVDKSVAFLPPKGSMIPLIIALDAAYTGDCFAMYVVSRHPDDTWDEVHPRVVKRFSKAWKPAKGQKLDFSKTVEPMVRMFAEDYNVFRVVYDPYQLHKMCTDLRNDGIPTEEFPQMGLRARADKQLYDMVIHRQFSHDGDEDDRDHAMHAARKDDGKHMRIIKKVTDKPIDLIVAASMAVYKCLRLNM